jgi:hypothetical protein
LFVGQDVNVPRPSDDQGETEDRNHVGKDGSAHGQPSGCNPACLRDVIGISL